jgi:hypothetical protein
MQIPPLTFEDVSTIIAILAIIFLILAEFATSSYGRTNMSIKTCMRVRNVAYFMAGLFLITVAIKIIDLFLGYFTRVMGI